MYRVDLKPQNIIFRDGLTPILVDLGLVKTNQLEEVITMTGVPLGTPRYVAPEQVEGVGVDIRNDLYALGVILYELIAGQPLRGDADTVVQSLYRLVSEDVDVSGLPCSAELRSVVARVLARSPDARFQTPAELRSALEAVPEAPPPP
jgi:serine/threonine protein kinase